jgi:hypothetical protein
MGFYVHNLATAIIVKILINICLGITNTIGEAIMVEMSIDSVTDENLQSGQVKEDKVSDEEREVDHEDSESSCEYTKIKEEDDQDNKTLLVVKVNATVDMSEEIKEKDISSDDEEPYDQDKSESKQKKAVNFVSVFLATTYVSTMIALYLGGLFLEKFPKRTLFQITALL